MTARSKAFWNIYLIKMTFLKGLVKIDVVAMDIAFIT